MALAGPDTGGSQFFITLSPQPHLDGGYTVFGEVIAGVEVLDRIRLGIGSRRWWRCGKLARHEHQDLLFALIRRRSRRHGPRSLCRAARPAAWRSRPRSRPRPRRRPPCWSVPPPARRSRRRRSGRWPRSRPGRRPTRRGQLAEVEPGAEVVVFLGTWCGDSRRELPRLWKALDSGSGAVTFQIRYIGVDHAKKEPADLVEGERRPLPADLHRAPRRPRGGADRRDVAERHRAGSAGAAHRQGDGRPHHPDGSRAGQPPSAPGMSPSLPSFQHFPETLALALRIHP